MRSIAWRAALPVAAALSLLALPAYANLASDSTDASAASAPAAPADAVARFRALVGDDGGALEQSYRTHHASLVRQTAAADELDRRIAALDSTTRAMLTEWEAELASIGSDSLRQVSRAGLDSARARHQREIAAMRGAEAAIAPALAAHRDRTLALKHAVAAAASGRMSATTSTVRTDAQRIRQEAERAARDADQALASR
jgi:hypothetical protein